MISEFYWVLPIVIVVYLFFSVSSQQKFDRVLRGQQRALDEQAAAAKQQMENSKNRLDESNDRARQVAERQERQLEIAEENLAIQHEVRDLLARMAKALERRV